MRAAVLLAVAGLLPCSAEACRLQVATGAMQGRIAGIAMTVEHASARVARRPAGWDLTAASRPPGTARVQGRAVVGAAFLSGRELPSLLVITPRPGFSCEGLASAPTTIVTLTFYADDRLVPSRIDGRQVTFTP